MAVIEIARFRLRAGVPVEEFLSQNALLELEFINTLPGYRTGSRRTTVTDAGTWVITVGWESQAAADDSIAAFNDAPAAKGFMDLIELSSMSAQRMTEIPAPSSRTVANVRGLYLEGIRDGNFRESVLRYAGERYTQHSTGVRDGVEGFIEFFEDFIERNPERHVDIVRAIADGSYVFVHAYQSLNGGVSQWVTMDLFDTDGNDRLVEHWDVISAFTGANSAGRTQVDGTTTITDLDRTEANKARVRQLIERVRIDGDGAPSDYIRAETYVEHNTQGTNLTYHRVVKVIGQGNFVVAYSQADTGGQDVAVFDLFRLEDGMIVEHWDNTEPVPPANELVNSGKF